MCRPYYAEPELAEDLFEYREYEVLAETTFGGVKQRMGLDEDDQWKVMTFTSPGSVQGLLKEMDEVGVEYICMDQTMQWSRSAMELMIAADIEKLAEMSDETDGRIVPGVGYNPYNIQESLDRIERAVEDLDFKYVWFHPMTFGLRPTDEKCYPLYTKARDLDVPVMFQTGHSAEPLPSEHGRPMYADEVAMDFPDLDLVLTHAGWPWCLEWCSMVWRHPNVYGNVGAYYPSFLPDELWDFVDTGRLRNSVMWATNGLGLERHREEFEELPIRDKTADRVLRENALELLDL
jgi:predicted TIM-barrel fold metal-dependent hydrolase